MPREVRIIHFPLSDDTRERLGLEPFKSMLQVDYRAEAIRWRKTAVLLAVTAGIQATALLLLSWLAS